MSVMCGQCDDTAMQLRIERVEVDNGPLSLSGGYKISMIRLHDATAPTSIWSRRATRTVLAAEGVRQQLATRVCVLTAVPRSR